MSFPILRSGHCCITLGPQLCSPASGSLLGGPLMLQDKRTCPEGCGQTEATMCAVVG
jgi:hypothetical protein